MSALLTVPKGTFFDVVSVCAECPGLRVGGIELWHLTADEARALAADLVERAKELDAANAARTTVEAST